MSLRSIFRPGGSDFATSGSERDVPTMISHTDRNAALDRIAFQLDRADRLCGELWAEIMAAAAVRTAAMEGRPGVARLNRFAADGAWVDAVFALIELELPAWRLRRAVVDDGEWHCALSRAPCLPEWLDQAVEASHRDLALALVKVAIEAIRESSGGESRPRSLPRSREPLHFVCCDNF